MADPSVGDDIAVAGIIANLLALPQSIPQEYQQAQQQRQQLTQMAPGLGLKPEDVNNLAPLPTMQQFPGTQVPVLGSVLRGIGTTGQMLQRVLGTAPAPRPPMQQLMDYAKLRYTGAETEKATAEAEKARRTTADTGKQPWIYQGMTSEEARKTKEKQSEGPNTPFKLWEKDHPGGTFEEWNKTQTEGAVEKATALQRIKNAAITNTTKTMKEAAPHVLHQIARVEKELTQVETGPFASRYQELWTGKVGAEDPAFMHYRTSVALLRQILQRMHAGGRASQGLLAEYEKMLNAGTQSAPNMHAALDEIRDYAEDIQSTPLNAGPAGDAVTPEDTTGRPTGLTPEDTQALQAIHAGPGDRATKVQKMRQYMLDHGIMPNAETSIVK